MILPFDLNFSVLELVDHACKLRFEVGSFVHVNDMTLCQFVEHRAYFRQSSSCCSLVSSLAQVAHCITCGFCIIMIVCFARCRLANTLQRAFVICHLCCLFVCILWALRGSPAGDVIRKVILLSGSPRIHNPWGKRSSAKGNRTPIARMKILSTNRYTMAPRFALSSEKACKSTAFF